MTETEIHVVACIGGCGKVYDRAEPDPAYVCNQCRMTRRGGV